MRDLLIFSALLLGVAAALPASAADEVAEDPNGADEDSPYQRHMRNGVTLYRDGDWDGAIAEFEAAYRAEPKASPLINLALAHKKLQDPARAVEVLETALREHEGSMPDDQIEAAEREIREMKALIAYVPVVVKPPEARLTVDGRAIDKDQLDRPLALSPGTRELRAEARGFRSVDKTVRVVSGRDNAIVELVLEPTEGEVVVSANDEEAVIEVDGKRRTQGSWRGRLSPGLHIIRVIDGDESERVDVVVQAGALHNVRQDDEGQLVSDAAIPRDEADPDRQPFGPPDVPDILRGVYFMGGGAFLSAGFLASEEDIRFEPSGSDRFGGAVSLHLGYRVADWAGFEVFGQFSDIRIEGTVEDAERIADPVSGTLPPVADVEDVTMILTSARFGALMRVMLPSRTMFRFVGTFGAGGMYEILKFRQASVVGTNKIKDATVFDETNETGVGFFVTLDLGVELEYQNVLFDLVIQNTVQTSKHFDRSDLGDQNALDAEPIFVAGPVLRVGYGLW